MQTISVPANERERLAALASYEILDTAPEFAYDEITQLAAQVTGCPIAVVTFIDETRDWMKAKYGVPPEISEAPRDAVPCSATICGSDLLVIPDLHADGRFPSLIAPEQGPSLRFYCGMPLINPDGYALGSLCVLDTEPREFTFQQGEAIRQLARQVVRELELRKHVNQLRHALKALDEAQKQVERERAQSDALLHRTLPAAIAHELKECGRVNPRFFDSATILFVDFESFTRLAERTEPRALVDQIDQFFTAFDAIAERHRLEMLKTIGDAYMCVGGLPEVNRTHPVDACLAAIEIAASMGIANARRETMALPRWDIRIGLHTGPVMAGIVGRRKFSYDVWGDAVNVAARIEAAGATRQINVSESVQHRVQALFDFEPRGTIDIKNKGPTRMYFLTGIKADLAQEAAPHLPGAAFHREAAKLFAGYVPADGA